VEASAAEVSGEGAKKEDMAGVGIYGGGIQGVSSRGAGEFIKNGDPTPSIRDVTLKRKSLVESLSCRPLKSDVARSTCTPVS
jgi:hypothetical protein